MKKVIMEKIAEIKEMDRVASTLMENGENYKALCTLVALQDTIGETKNIVKTAMAKDDTMVKSAGVWDSIKAFGPKALSYLNSLGTKAGKAAVTLGRGTQGVADARLQGLINKSLSPELAKKLLIEGGEGQLTGLGKNLAMGAAGAAGVGGIAGIAGLGSMSGRKKQRSLDQQEIDDAKQQVPYQPNIPMGFGNVANVPMAYGGGGGMMMAGAPSADLSGVTARLNSLEARLARLEGNS